MLVMRKSVLAKIKMHPLVSSWLFWACHVDGLHKMSANNNLRNTAEFSRITSSSNSPRFFSFLFPSTPVPSLSFHSSFSSICLCMRLLRRGLTTQPTLALQSSHLHPLPELQAHQHCIFSESRNWKVWTWREDSKRVDWQAGRLGYITLSLNACRHTGANWSTLPLPGWDLGYGTQYLFTHIFCSVQMRATESTVAFPFLNVPQN